MQSLQKLSMTAVAGLAIGCAQGPHDVQELTPENQVLINTLVDDALREKEVVKQLIRSADPLFDAAGDSGHTDQLEADIEQAANKLKAYRDQNRIYQFDSGMEDPAVDTGQDVDVLAIHHASKTNKDSKRSYIAFDVADKGQWSANVGMHEVGHDYADHSREVNLAVEKGVSWDDLFSTALQEKDFPYLMTELFLIPDTVLSNRRFEVDSQTEYVLDQFQKGIWDEATAEAELSQRLVMHDEDWTAEQTLQMYDRFGEQLARIGVNEEDLAEALYDETFQDSLNQVNEEARRETLREIRGELQSDRDREIHSGMPIRR